MFNPDESTWGTNADPWQPVEQGGEQLQFIDFQGRRLSLLWDCAVRYPAFEKNEFECRHGLSFPYFVIAGASDVELIMFHDTFVKLRRSGKTIGRAKQECVL
ncbi:MAG: hypothetical protein V1767_00805 [Chloroflexota bacterium]